MSAELIKKLRYDTNTWVTSIAKEFPPDPFCNGFIIFNTSIAPSVVMANGVPIPGGGSLTIGGNLGEIFVGRLQISFAGGGVPSCTIMQKFYVQSAGNTDCLI